MAPRRKQPPKAGVSAAEAAAAAQTRQAVCTRNGCGWVQPCGTEEGARVLADLHARRTGHEGVITTSRGTARERR